MNWIPNPSLRTMQAFSAAPAVTRRPVETAARYAVAYLALCFYFLAFSRYGLNLWDEGALAYGSLRTLHGQVPMRDFNPIGYLPGRYLFGALLFKLSGVSLESLRFGMALLTPAMVLMSYAIARRLMPAAFALLAAACVASAPAMYYNRFFPFFCVLNLYCLVRALEHPGRRRWLILCAAILLSFPFKPEVALFSAALSIGLLFRGHALRVPNISPGASSLGFFPALFGLAVAVGGLSYYLIRQEVPAKLFSIVVETHRVWGNPFPALFPFFELWDKMGPHVMFERVLFYLPPLVYLGMGGHWLIRGWRKGNAPHRRVLAAVWGFGVCAFGLVVWRAGFDNLLRTLPPFYILVSYLLYLLYRRLTKNTLSPTRPPTRWSGTSAHRVSAGAAVILFPMVFLIEMNGYHGFYAGSAGAAWRETAPLTLERAQVWTNPTEADWVRRIVERIERFTDPGDPVLALPLNPIFNFLTDRANPIIHDWILPGMLDTDARQEVIHQLAAHPPRLVILSDIAIDGREERRFSNYAPDIYQYIQQNFAVYESIGLYTLWLSRAKPRAP